MIKSEQDGVDDQFSCPIRGHIFAMGKQVIKNSKIVRNFATSLAGQKWNLYTVLEEKVFKVIF